VQHCNGLALPTPADSRSLLYSRPLFKSERHRLGRGNLTLKNVYVKAFTLREATELMAGAWLAQVAGFRRNGRPDSRKQHI